MSAEFKYLADKMRDAGLSELAEKTDHHRNLLERRDQLPRWLSTPARAPAGYVDLYIKLRQKRELRRAAIRTRRFISEVVFPAAEATHSPALVESLAGASSRDKLRHALISHTIAHPGDLIQLKPFAQELKITLERVRQIYNELMKEGIELPIIRSRGDYQLFLKSIKLINEGHNIVTAAKVLKMDEHRLLSLITMFVEGEVTDLTTHPLRTAVARRRDDVQALAEGGLNTAQIITDLESTHSKISRDLRILQEQGKIPRKRKKRTMGQALLERRAQVKQLRNDGLSTEEIAKSLRIDYFDVQADIKVLIRLGEVEKKRP